MPSTETVLKYAACFGRSSRSRHRSQRSRHLGQPLTGNALNVTQASLSHLSRTPMRREPCSSACCYHESLPYASCLVCMLGNVDKPRPRNVSGPGIAVQACEVLPSSLPGTLEGLLVLCARRRMQDICLRCHARIIA